MPPEDIAGSQLDAVVELAGGIEGPLAWSRTALGSGTPYVTANKALLANHGDELSALARQRGAALLASASVGGGVPMLETVHHLAGVFLAQLRIALEIATRTNAKNDAIAPTMGTTHTTRSRSRRRLMHDRERAVAGQDEQPEEERALLPAPEGGERVEGREPRLVCDRRTTKLKS